MADKIMDILKKNWMFLLIIIGGLFLAFGTATLSKAQTITPAPPEQYRENVQYLRIYGLYDENKNNVYSENQAIVSGVANVKYMKLKISVKNTDTVPLTFNVLSFTDSSSMPTETITINPGEKYSWVTNYIDVAKYIGKGQFCSDIKGQASQRLPQTINGCINIDIKSDALDPAKFEVSLDKVDETTQVGVTSTIALSGFTKQIYDKYLSTYVLSDGSVLSNAQSVSWCPNSCIGCDADRTSEGIGRLAKVAFNANDRATFDKEVTYYLNTMKDPSNNLMMWKLDSANQPGSCGGQNSAVDAELIFIDYLIKADAKWGTHAASGKRYIDIAKPIMNTLKTGTVQNLLPYCMYPVGSEARSCENKVFLGYVNLVALKDMCTIDSFWCTSYESHKSIMLGAIQNGGVYSAYNIDTKQYSWENADIHPNWVILHLAENAETLSSVNTFYQQGRDLYYAQNKKICQEFQPGAGCKQANPDLRVYAHYLEIAKIKGDTTFATDLNNFITQKIQEQALSPLSAQDNYGNIVVLEALTR